jgi:molecular chaperone HscB
MEPSSSLCWNCQKRTGEEHFCTGCGKILPQRPGTDYFKFFGLPRKLNLDLEDLEKRFYTLSRKLHPDNFHRASPREKLLSLDKSAVLNDAYRTLKEPLTRAEYLLSLEGQKMEVHAKQAPPELLEEVFELNEWLAELKMAPPREGQNGHLAELRRQLETAKTHLQQRVEAFHQELIAIFTRWDAAVDSGNLDGQRQDLLEELSKTLAKRNYLRNLIRDVSAALAGQAETRNSNVEIRNSETAKGH